MIDGERDFVDEFLDNFLKFYAKITDKSFSAEIDSLQQSQYLELKEKDSLVTSSIVLGLKAENPKYFINIETPHTSDQIIQKVNNEINPIQLENLQTELSALTLFQINKPPIDLSQLIILFEEDNGLYFIKDMNYNHFYFRKELIFAFLDQNKSDKDSVNEIVEPHIFDMLTAINIQVVYQFKTGVTCFFTDYQILSKASKKKKQEEKEPAEQDPNDIDSDEEVEDKELEED